MSEQGFYEEEDVQDQVQQPRDPVRSHLKKLEQENKELRQLKADAEAAKRKLAFVEAGVDLSSPVAEYFVKGYDGEISAEAIKSAASKLNLTPQSAPAPQQVAPAEQQAWSRMGNAARVGDAGEPEVDFASRISNAKSEREVMELLAQARANQTNII
jgi:hypothetical protein